MKKFFIQTWGCQMNEYDSSRLIDLMCSSGYVQTEEISEGDVVILITCAIREKAQEKVFNQLFSWKHKKQYKENAVVCLGMPGRIRRRTFTRCGGGKHETSREASCVMVNQI